MPAKTLPRSSPAPSPLVCVLAHDGLCTFEFGIAVEVFGLPRPEFDPWYRFRVVAAEAGPLRGLGGLEVRADAGLEALAEADLILVPGWRGAGVPVPDALAQALSAAHARGTRVASICSGVFVLAAAGLLIGRRATTHWRYVEAFRSAHPAVTLDPDVLYVDEGDVLTSAGSAAGLDLCLHIVRRDFGSTVANTVARRLVLPAHREGGQRQFIPRPVPKVRGSRIAPLLDLLRSRLDEDWPVARMATEAGLSERTLLRRMHDATGQSPQSWLTAERVARAVSLLETTPANLDDIALAVGFRSPETMRHHFRQVTGKPPMWYRQHFAGDGTAA